MLPGRGDAVVDGGDVGTEGRQRAEHPPLVAHQLGPHIRIISSRLSLRPFPEVTWKCGGKTFDVGCPESATNAVSSATSLRKSARIAATASRRARKRCSPACVWPLSDSTAKPCVASSICARARLRLVSRNRRSSRNAAATTTAPAISATSSRVRTEGPTD